MNKRNENKFKKRVMMNDLLLAKYSAIMALDDVKKLEKDLMNKLSQDDKKIYAETKHTLESLDSPASYHNGTKLVSDFLSNPLDSIEDEIYRMNIDKTFLDRASYYLRMLKNFLIRK